MNDSQENKLQEFDSTLDILLTMDLNEHDMLFACEEDSTPMEFCMNPSSDIKISKILQKLSSLVEKCGGNLKFNFHGGGSNSIKLVRKGETILSKNDDLFFSDYLVDCLYDGKLKDLNTYRINKSNYDSTVNVMDILNKKKTWNEAKRKSTSDVEISDFGSDEETLIRKQSKASPIRKSLYTKEEEMKILHYIIKKKLFSAVKSRQMWQVMEKKKICGNRTWQSMKERFIKYIVPKIKTYKLDDADESRILRGFNYPNCNQTRNKFLDSSSSDVDKEEPSLEFEASEIDNDRQESKNCLIKDTDILDKSVNQVIPEINTEIRDTIANNTDDVISTLELDCDDAIHSENEEIPNQEKQHKIINMNSANHKCKSKCLVTADVCHVSAEIASNEPDVSIEDSEVGRKNSKRKEIEDNYSSNFESTQSDSDNISEPTSMGENQHNYTLTFHAKHGFRKKLMGQSWKLDDDECKFSIAEDIMIIKYIFKHEEIENILGRKMWVLMQQQCLMKDRTWQSLKDRFNKRILPNISAYETEGLSCKIIDFFKKHQGARSCDDSINKASPAACTKDNNRFYTKEEKCNIVQFIVENRRFNQIKGNQLFKIMSKKMPNPKKRTWQSLQNTFKRYIMPNIGNYVTSNDILLKFKDAWIKKRRKKINFRKPPSIDISTDDEEVTSTQRNVKSIKKSKKLTISSDEDSSSETNYTETEDSDATVKFHPNKSSSKNNKIIKRRLFNQSLELFEEMPPTNTNLTNGMKNLENNIKTATEFGSPSDKTSNINKINSPQSSRLTKSPDSTTKFTTVVDIEHHSPPKTAISETSLTPLPSSKTNSTRATDTELSNSAEKNILETVTASSPMAIITDTEPISPSNTKSKSLSTSLQDRTNLSPTRRSEGNESAHVDLDSLNAKLNSSNTELNSNPKSNSPNSKLNSPNAELNLFSAEGSDSPMKSLTRKSGRLKDTMNSKFNSSGSSSSSSPKNIALKRKLDRPSCSKAGRPSKKKISQRSNLRVVQLQRRKPKLIFEKNVNNK